MDEDDEQDDWYDEQDDRFYYERACVDCGTEGIDLCCCCGGWLCGMCSEVGCGFCNNCPTEEWITEQEATLCDQH
jgi:hypothetical protein